MKNKLGVAWLAGVALGVALSTPALARCVPHVGEPVQDMSMLEIKATAMDVSMDDGHRMVTTLGTITNPSTNCFGNVVVELQYFDASKNHIDTVVEKMPDLLVPAGESVEFRVREPASREAAVYATQSLRMVDADVIWDKAPAARKNPWVDLLSSWVPMLVLIGAWIFIMRRHYGKNSARALLVAASQSQLKAAQEQTEALRRIAAVLEQSRTPGSQD